MKSPSVRKLAEEGKTKVIGAIYDVGKGKVAWVPIKQVDRILKKVEASPGRAIEPLAIKSFNMMRNTKRRPCCSDSKVFY